MTMPRVGREVSAADYWAARADSYASDIDGEYHRHRLAVIRALIAAAAPTGTCVDFGCGDGVLLADVAELGCEAVGIDIEPRMIDLAEQRLAGSNPVLLVGGLECLEGIADNSADLLLGANVHHYFTDAEDRHWYEHARRIVRPGGSMIVVHSNELFDLFTLNRFTAEFHAVYLSDTPVDTLLTNPGAPERIDFNIRENPLAYRHKLADYGFVERRQEFIGHHPAPPLLMPSVDIAERTYLDTLTVSERDRWRLQFTCSMFASVSVRDG